MRSYLLRMGKLGLAGVVVGGYLTAMGPESLVTKLGNSFWYGGAGLNPFFLGYAAINFALLVVGTVGRMQTNAGPVTALAIGNGCGVLQDPPQNAEYLLYLFLDHSVCEALLGDLAEGHKRIQKRQGIWRADLWYWKQAVFSAWPVLWGILEKFVRSPLGVALITALTAAVVDVDWVKGVVGYVLQFFGR